MKILKIRYGKKDYLILYIGSANKNAIALKIHGPTGSNMSDSDIKIIRNRADELIKSDIESRINILKSSIYGFKSLYRTFSLSKLKILREYDLKPL